MWGLWEVRPSILAHLLCTLSLGVQKKSRQQLRGPHLRLGGFCFLYPQAPGKGLSGGRELGRGVN